MTVDQAKSLLRATALLHDVGHLPFSHGGEAVLPKNNISGEPTTHEQVSIAFIREHELSDLLEKELYNGFVEYIEHLLVTSQTLPVIFIYKRIFTVQLLANKIDYL